MNVAVDHGYRKSIAVAVSVLQLLILEAFGKWL